MAREAEVEQELSPAEVQRLDASQRMQGQAAEVRREALQATLFDPSHEGSAASRAERLSLDRDVRVDEGLQRIGVACLRHFAANHAALHRGDRDGVHQSRVALRRLRAALSLFAAVLGDDESEQVKRGLRWLTSQLGPARDYEVFLEETLAPLQQAGEHEAALDQLQLAVRQRRDARLEEAQRVAAGDGARRVLLQTALWLVAGAWLGAPQTQRQRRKRLMVMAKRTLAQRSKKLTKRLQRFEELDPDARHKLRIAVKKLHYGTEFFASLFPKRKRRRERYLGLLKKLQDHLGQLNDMHTHEAMAHELAHGDVSEAATFAMGVVRGIEQKRAHSLEVAARKTSKKLARTRPFWA